MINYKKEEDKSFKNIAEKSAFEREAEVLRFWKENNIFEKSIEKNKGKAETANFSFFDGPPFATGMPHHGHILQSFMKDSVPRYQTMRGKSVRRVWGWDCHGLPIENLIEKELGLSSKKGIEEYGVDKFYQSCADSVLRYETEWKKIIPQIGRWVDMDSPYKTMDATYTESVWWSFKQLYDKGLAYEGFKVMHICPRCETPLAQSEVALGGYRDVTDISVYVPFELVDEPCTFLLAWTTTPWTLPGNTAIAVNAEINYLKLKTTDGKVYILAEKLAEDLFKKKEIAYEVIDSISGKNLIGRSYKPIFPYFNNETFLNNLKDKKENIWRVWHADFVDDTLGTGIAHEAPAFGEDDMALAVKNNIPVIKHVKINGEFVEDVIDFKGLIVKKKDDYQSTDVEIIKWLAKEGKLFAKEKIMHSYPHCWRCDTPLLNYGTTSWFVAVTKIREKLLSENANIGWVPQNVRDGRFGKWLEGARDWAVSRSRYWGAPVPVWKSEKTGEVFVPGSLSELMSRTKSQNNYTLVRHAQAEGNLTGYVSIVAGEGKDTLTDLGKSQAKEAGEALAKQKKIDLIVTSPFGRTRQTAEIMAKELGISPENVVIDERLREFNPGKEYSGRKWEEVIQTFHDKQAKHFTGKISEDGESHRDLMLRGVQTVLDLEEKYQGKNILIVSHRSMVRWLAFYASGNLSMNPNMKECELPTVANAQLIDMNWKQIPHDETGAINFHMPFIDRLKVYDKEGSLMEREKLVFDCWYESGSMPYGQLHYPFENKQLFEENFPADFIGEAQDQTRGWFYTMLILSTALFDKTSFKNVICTGHIMAEDGKKMSKSLRNYTDPMELVSKYGSDSLRYYLLSSPVIRGESMNFSDKGLGDVYRKNISRLVNVIAMYMQYATSDLQPSTQSTNVLDKFILARIKQVKSEVTAGFDIYELDKAFRPIEKFIDDLSIWYLRRSRDRIKSEDQEIKSEALATLQHTLVEFSKIIAPIMPFLSEYIYQSVKPVEDMTQSVHLLDWGEISDLNVEEAEIVAETEKVRNIISKILEERSNVNIKVKQPLSNADISLQLDLLPDYKNQFVNEIVDETNLKALNFANLAEGKSVVLDTNITEDLLIEGVYREVARAAQDARKEKNLQPQDKVSLYIKLDNNSQISKALNTFETELKAQCNIIEIIISENLENGLELSVGEERAIFKLN